MELPYINFFRWQDLIDILVIAYIVYRVMLFFVDTRAMQLVRGLIVIAAVGIVARALDLRTLSWLLSHLLSAFLIAIPIVFQPELRRMLEEIGRGRLWSKSTVSQEGETAKVEAMTRALLYLQEKRIGAIIVFQRYTGLKEIWRSAVQLRADITQELLVSIFWPKNPLHDGAVIVDSHRIIAAACYLPLTEKSDISRWYGTRHRAAIGVTEVSDAHVLIVSEEQGAVTLAVRGRLSRPLNEEQIRRFMRRYFEKGDQNETLLQKVKEELQSQWPGKTS